MPAFRRVEGTQAGPNALGILVPPGKRTLVILRPRQLDLDLVLERPRVSGNSGLWEVHPLEATQLVRKLRHLLESGPAAHSRTTLAHDGAGLEIRVQFADLELVACPRVPGSLYQPARFANEARAAQTASRIVSILNPAPDANQEVYCNTRHFGA